VPRAFHWIPFTALLEGSLSANVVGMGHAMFWIGGGSGAPRA
jgi:hypothetical protein